MSPKTLKKIKEEIPSPPKVGEIVEGKVLTRSRSSLFLDLGPKGIGVIYGKEFFEAKDVLKGLNAGDVVMTKVLDIETEDGYRELSLAQANQELAWKELYRIKESEETFEIPVKGANKGGLIFQVRGIPAFLPASQLSPEHYPKVEGAEPAKIVQELQKLVGKTLKVRIFDVDVVEKKLILSEKITRKEKTEGVPSGHFNVGDVVEGEISGVTSFGAFLKFGEGMEGLIHSSEIPDSKTGLIMGQKVKAKITEIANNRVYLSLKDAA